MKLKVFLSVVSAVTVSTISAGCSTKQQIPLVAANDNYGIDRQKSPEQITARKIEVVGLHPVAANDNYEPASLKPLVPIAGGKSSTPKITREQAAAQLKERLLEGKNESHIDGLDPKFTLKLASMLASMPIDVRKHVHILSGYRSFEHQEILWKKALKKYGTASAARKWVAAPGKSNHQRGTAVDLDYGGSRKAESWVHGHAGEYGLYFPMKWEPWHIEPVGSRP
ncbi:M15 family metallopeptidase [Aquibium sp. LZ166]|uniref:M15 family metallopeptidase n=1 Tax=Aquibium pacificus TaxID=3153579 RepID=A0ABV3SSW4_9HYPH